MPTLSTPYYGLRFTPMVFWMTGLSGAGKSSLAEGAAEQLRQQGLPVVVLDGDILRRGLCADLGFSTVDRTENNRRCAEVAKLLMTSAGQICICAFISPLESMRLTARRIVGAERLRTIFVDCDLQTCMERDPKGNYRKVRQGAIKGYTGVDAPFEPPANPDFTLHTDAESLEKSVERMLTYVAEQIDVFS